MWTEMKTRKREARGRGEAPAKKFQIPMRKRACRFCVDKKIPIDYKDTKFLQLFLSERGRILPRRLTGNCAKHQREVTNAIKRARILAFIPFTATQAPFTL